MAYSFDPKLNLEASGGRFNKLVRKLQTYTIHLHENGRYYVTDDRSENRCCTSGHATVEDAVKANRWSDDKRTWA